MKATGAGLLARSEEHLHERYVLGALAPKNDPDWVGPWDCAELAAWLIYQAGAGLYGCNRDHGDPATADAGTVYFNRDARYLGKIIAPAAAAGSPGALLLRVAAGSQCGHIVISDGKGGTVEAHSHLTGVIRDVVSGRRWTMGIMVPGIEYQGPPADWVPFIKPPAVLYRLTAPPMQGQGIRKLQYRLRDLGYLFDPADGIYGPQTMAAVLAFQRSRSLVADGECGPRTLAALEISL